jgi:hypothetical protein
MLRSCTEKQFNEPVAWPEQCGTVRNEICGVASIVFIQKGIHDVGHC